ncbi:MAG: class I SAM-dependent methyltransferase [Candidatus Binatia bacterium]
MTTSQRPDDPQAAEEHGAAYVPALGFSRLTWLYDWILATTLKEEKFKRLLVEQARVEPGQRVLDLGCGTATLTIMLKRACPEAQVVGLDGDPEILEIARRKIAAAEVEIELRPGLAFDPPFEAASFDRIVSSLVFHHLATEQKLRTFEASRKLLRPGGELHIADWGKARSFLARAAFLGVQMLDGFANTADNVRGRLIPMMNDAGFVRIAETHREPTLFGTLALHRAAVA